MTNHNFLPYEVCCMLPQINPYDTGNNKMYWIKPYPHSNYDRLTISYHSTSSINQSCKERDAWTILDCLQWLEDEHDFMVTVDFFVLQQGMKWRAIVYDDNRDMKMTPTIYTSRTEAYIEGIKVALKLI